VFKELRQQPLSQSVVEVVRDAIIQGRLKPGEPLIQAQLASELGVSRGPVREALHKLEEEGLVTNTPYKGTVVTPLNRRDVEELRSLRTVLERFAAHLAVERLADDGLDELEASYRRMKQAANAGDRVAFGLEDLAFHTKICDLSGHKLLFEVWQLYATRFRRVLALRNEINRDLHDVLEMHNPLLDAFREHDHDAIGTFYDRHGADLTAVLMETWPDGSSVQTDGASAGTWAERVLEKK
jgi:DNA-binding GntR family transcriptional regulator